MISLTESAIEAVGRFIKSSETPDAGLRISIQGGGCSGFQYGLNIDTEFSDADTIMEYGDVKVFVDAESAPLLDGVTVDFVDSIEGAGFKFENPNATASCGCGNSFTA